MPNFIGVVSVFPLFFIIIFPDLFIQFITRIFSYLKGLLIFLRDSRLFFLLCRVCSRTRISMAGFLNPGFIVWCLQEDFAGLTVECLLRDRWREGQK